MLKTLKTKPQNSDFTLFFTVTKDTSILARLWHEHIKYKKSIQTFTGKQITVRFDRPTALQIDGETVSGVTEYTVYANA